MKIDLTSLTLTEQQVITLAAQGLSFDDVADELGMSSRTARNHAQSAGKKLGYKPITLIKLMAA